MKMIIALIPKMLATLTEAVFNRFMLKWILKKLVKRTDTLLDDNGLELVYHLKDGEAELAMQKLQALGEELELFIKNRKKD